MCVRRTPLPPPRTAPAERAADARSEDESRGRSPSSSMSSDDSSEDEDEKQRRLRISGILVTSEQVKTEEAARATEAAKPRDVASEGDGGVTGRMCSEFEKHQTRQLHAMLERTFAKRLHPGVWEASASWAAAPASSLCLFASSTVSPPPRPPLCPPLRPAHHRGLLARGGRHSTPTSRPPLTAPQVRQPHEGLPTGAGHSAATSAASQGAESGQPGGSAGGPESFNWKKSIKAQLRAAEGQQLPLKRLRKGTVAACQAHGGAAAAKEELKATFDKKLAKMAAVETVGDSVRLGRAS